MRALGARIVRGLRDFPSASACDLPFGAPPAGVENWRIGTFAALRSLMELPSESGRQSWGGGERAAVLCVVPSLPADVGPSIAIVRAAIDDAIEKDALDARVVDVVMRPNADPDTDAPAGVVCLASLTTRGGEPPATSRPDISTTLVRSPTPAPHSPRRRTGAARQAPQRPGGTLG